MDSRFLNLQKWFNQDSLPVIRGKFSVTQTVSVFDLVVGDVVILKAGNIVPADCVIIECNDLLVNEAKVAAAEYEEGEEDEMIIKMRQEIKKTVKDDPFLYSSSQILKGSAKAVVCCVGKNSRRVVTKIETKTNTPLQKRLDIMSKSLIKLGLIAAVIIFLASMVNFVIRASTSDNYPVTVMINDIVQYLTQAITIVLVAAPEGLSLVITMSLAYSVSLMKNDGLLIKELKVPERSARIQEILIGKTGTLTTGDLKVANFYICGVDRENQRNNSLYNVKIPNHALDLIEDSIINNTEARMEINDQSCYEPLGNNTDVSLLKFLQNAGVPVHNLVKEKAKVCILQFPFSTEEKRSAVVIKYEKLNIVRIYVKGAHERIIPGCTHTLDEQAQTIEWLSFDKANCEE